MEGRAGNFYLDGVLGGNNGLTDGLLLRECGVEVTIYFYL